MEKYEDLEHSEFVKKYRWLIRPCEDYENEAKDCKRFSSRFHQYFVHGSFTDCSSWVRDTQNCEKCILDFNDSSCKDIIKNEVERRTKRYEAHLQNDVWEKREKPPDNWNTPLPEWWYLENKDSYFSEWNEEFKEYIAHNVPKKEPSCVIL